MSRLTRKEARRLRRIMARSWEDPVAAAHARDELTLHMLTKRRPGRRNPNKDRRYATTRIIRRPPPPPVSEQTTRVYRKNPKKTKRARTPSERDWRGFAAVKRAMKINPGRRETTAQRDARLRRWWNSRTSAERRKLLTMLSPALCRNPGNRPMSKAMQAMSRADRARGRRRKAHVRSYDRWIRKARKNPKRDGSPTRGEKRRAKYLLYLKSLQQTGADATKRIALLTSEVSRTVGPRAIKHVEKLPQAEYLERRMQDDEVATEQAPAEDKPVPTEAKFVQSRIRDIDALIKDAQEELKSFDLDSDADADLAGEVQDRIAKLAKQKRTLTDKLADVMATQTNPRRRGGRKTVLVRRSTLRRLDRALASLRRSIRAATRAAWR